MVLNQQKAQSVDLAGIRAFVGALRTHLGLKDREFNVCIVDDSSIARLNEEFRGKPGPTDVLSFPWTPAATALPGMQRDEFASFLGDIVISAETASRSAGAEGHRTAAELRLLILHGLLHLLGMDHETDNGEMTARELELRGRLGLNGVLRTKARSAARKTRSHARLRRAMRQS
jgi:probable rRNA maturation factor